MFKKTLIIPLFVLAFNLANAQMSSAGVGFGFHMRNNVGINTVGDSIVIEAQGSRSMLNVYSIFFDIS